MRLLAALLAAAASTAVAAPFTVPVGDARIALDAPPGFADVMQMGSPRLADMAEATTSASNRILLFALEDADVRRFSTGDDAVARRYGVIATPKAMERERVTPAAFESLVRASQRELSAPPGDIIDLYRYLDTRPRGQSTLIVQLRKDPQVMSVLQGLRLPDNPEVKAPPKYMLTTTTLMLVRGRALNVAVYTMYDSEADIEWIRAFTGRWIEDLQRLNSR